MKPHYVLMSDGFRFINKCNIFDHLKYIAVAEDVKDALKFDNEDEAYYLKLKLDELGYRFKVYELDEEVK